MEFLPHEAFSTSYEKLAGSSPAGTGKISAVSKPARKQYTQLETTAAGMPVVPWVLIVLEYITPEVKARGFIKAKFKPYTL